MTATGFEYMPLNRQLFRRSIAEALTDLLGQKYRTAKTLAKVTGIDPSTAENLRKGHLSVPTLQKLLTAEGPDLWDRLGEEIFGETAVAREERRLRTIIEEAEHARSNIHRIRARADEVLSGASSHDPAGDRLGLDPARREIGGAGPGPDLVVRAAAQGRRPGPER